MSTAKKSVAMRARSKAIVTMLVFVLIIPVLLVTIVGTSAIKVSQVIQSTGVIKYDDWPMYHHDPSSTGYSASKAPKTNGTLWIYKIPKITQSGGGVAVANGKIFVPHMDGVDVLNVTTGMLMTHYHAQYVNCVPAVADGKVFFTGEGFEYMVFAFDEVSGSKIWTFTTPGILWRSSPIVADGIVFVSDDTNTLYAINASNGKSLWNSTKATWAFTSSVAGGLVFSLDRYETYVALNESTSEVVWSFTPNYPGYPVGRMPVAIANGTVFAIGAVRYAYALNLTNGSVIWRQRYGAWGEDFITTPSVGYGMVFLGCSDGKIYAINQTTGSLIWTSTSLGSFEVTPAVADEMVLVSVGMFGSEGNIFALNKTSGDIVWKSYVGQRWGDMCNPVVSYGKLFVYVTHESGENEIICFGSDERVRITVETNQPSYQVGEDIYLYGNLTYDGAPVPENLVAIEIQNPNNDTVVSNTRQTDAEGAYNLTFKLPTDAKLGTYTVYVSSSYMGETATNKTTFDLVALVHDIATKNVVPSETKVYEGNIININVTVKNEGTVSETFNVTAFYDGNVIQTQIDIALNPSIESTLTFIWNTSGVPGNHIISANASIVFGEVDISDNTFVDGIVEVVAKKNVPIPGDGNAIVEGNVTITKAVVRKNALHFEASGPSGLTGWINVTFPMINTTEIKVFINKEKLTPPPFPIITTNGTNYFIYFEFTLSTHEITIQYAITDITVTNITFSKQSPAVNETIYIYATVENRGNFTETFDVSLNYTLLIDPLIGTQTITLEPGAKIILNFTWTPTGGGRYEIEVYTSAIPNDINPSDNIGKATIYVRQLIISGPHYTQFGIEYWIVEFIEGKAARVVSNYY